MYRQRRAERTSVVHFLEANDDGIAIAGFGDGRDGPALLEPVRFRPHHTHHRPTRHHLDALREESTTEAAAGATATSGDERGEESAESKEQSAEPEPRARARSTRTNMGRGQRSEKRCTNPVELN